MKWRPKFQLGGDVGEVINSYLNLVKGELNVGSYYNADDPGKQDGKQQKRVTKRHSLCGCISEKTTTGRCIEAGSRLEIPTGCWS